MVSLGFCRLNSKHVILVAATALCDIFEEGSEYKYVHRMTTQAFDPSFGKDTQPFRSLLLHLCHIFSSDTVQAISILFLIATFETNLIIMERFKCTIVHSLS